MSETVERALASDKRRRGDAAPEAVGERVRSSNGAHTAAAWNGDAADDLFERLRALRKEIADRQGVPAYVVFSDRTLREMAETRPRTESELLEVSGVGPAKLARYGERFLSVIAEG
jgi:ATP-dependent DNA helicase RecQ